MVISSINYDGAVPYVESDEYAVITNNGDWVVNVQGWRLYAGDPGQNFYFPNFVFQPGQSCRIYTNEIHPETCGLVLGAEKRFGIIAVIVGICMMEMEINWINTVIDTTLVLNDGPIIRRIL